MHSSRLILCPCTPGEGTADLQRRLADCGVRDCHPFHLLPWVAAELTPEALHRFLARNPDASVLPDRLRHLPPVPFGPAEWAEALGPAEGPSGSPADPLLSPVALSQTGADQVHALGIDGSGVRLCIIDSGVDFTHPDLQGTAILNEHGQPLAADFTNTDLTDTVGHGTAVAGCIVAQAREVHAVPGATGSGPIAYTRIRGLAPGARLMSAKVFDARVVSGYDSAIIAALEWAAEQGAHIINMSLGGLSIPNDGTDPLSAAVAAVRERGILVVVSAGNEGGGLGTLSTPGSAPGALTAGASTTFRSFAQMGYLTSGDRWTADQLAAFSSLGPTMDGRPKPDLLAPGAYDWGLAPMNRSQSGTRIQLFGGTSQAAPFLAACAALLYQAFHRQHGRYPTPDEATHLLMATADDLGLPAHMQGAGRINILRAVRAALGLEPVFTAPVPDPAVAAAGEEGCTYVAVKYQGSDPAVPEAAAFRYEPVRGADLSVIGEVSGTHPVQEIPLQVEAGTDLLHVSVTWPTEEHGPTTPRLLLALYDPAGRLANYQRPSGPGDHELGKCVDAWVTRPAPGRWLARVQLRDGTRTARQPFTLLAVPHRRNPWSWISVAGTAAPMAPGETRTLTVQVRVPSDVAPGTYVGHLRVGTTLLPVTVVVPISLARGQGRFAGRFQHGFQGSWGHGDWICHHLFVPPDTPSLAADLQWPDVDNAVEFYLIDPAGRAVMGKSNVADVLDDGDTDVMTSQILLSDPRPGMWRLLTHSFAFSGRGRPEPYRGAVRIGAQLVSPRLVNVQVNPGEPAPVALVVRNPGRAPLRVRVVARTEEPALTWHPFTAEVPPEAVAAGHPGRKGYAPLATLEVPHGARLIGAVLQCADCAAPLVLSLVDPISRSGRVSAPAQAGAASVLEASPVPGRWTLLAGLIPPAIGGRPVTVSGSLFVLAPRPLDVVDVQWVTVQPGAEAIVPVRIHLPPETGSLRGSLTVITPEQDHLGTIPFRITVVPSAPETAPAPVPSPV
ncbi:MAG TPA: S8 family serine peptidase [Symbiobacteriaceae bacterium]